MARFEVGEQTVTGHLLEVNYIIRLTAVILLSVLIQPDKGNNNSKKSRIRETPTLLTDADIRTDTIFEMFRDIFLINFF